MTIQQFYRTLTFIDELDSTLGLQTSLDLIAQTLTTLVNTPNQPPLQSALASALAKFSSAAEQLDKLISPSRAAIIAEMGGSEFFDPAIAERVDASISKNAMTPSVARDFVQELATGRRAFLDTARKTIQGLETLGVKVATLEPGSADLEFLIPRELFENHLGKFAKELTFINRLIEHLSEGITGNAEPVKVEALSSSVPSIGVAAGLAVVATLATVVNKFLEAWERIQKLRNVRNDLAELNLKGTNLEELTEEITTTVETVVEESTQLVLSSYQGEPSRKNELENALKQDTRRLFGQIERGLTIEFRAEPKPNQTEGDRKALTTISNLGQRMTFPERSQEPMLLESGQVVEGDIATFTHSTKSTTHKSTTSRKSKESKKETT